MGEVITTIFSLPIVTKSFIGDKVAYEVGRRGHSYSMFQVHGEKNRVRRGSKIYLKVQFEGNRGYNTLLLSPFIPFDILVYGAFMLVDFSASLPNFLHHFCPFEAPLFSLNLES